VKSFGRIHGRANKAVPVWVCSRPGCEVHHRGAYDAKVGKIVGPAACIDCGGLAFDRFDSIAEANGWASLRVQEKRGVITGLRRQVRYPLFAPSPSGLPVQVATYVADYVYIRDGQQVIGDKKPSADPRRQDPVAALKLRWMEAQGTPVTILT
jgi:hypothetical protein